jgi:bacterioferritin
MRLAIYKINKPYPKIDPQIEDHYITSLLLEDYAGIISEYSATSQYMFYHFVSDDKISQDFFGIGLVEMMHLKLLANCITSLGGCPVFRNSYNTAWNSNVIPYGTSTKERLLLSIQSEYESIKQYSNHAAIIPYHSVKMLLNRIILDEKKHIHILEENLNSLSDYE